MKPSPRYLLLAAGLFAAWIGWLVYLAATSRDQVILSRPQFLVAHLHVLARLTGTAEHPDAKVTIVEVSWAVPGQQRAPKDAEIPVSQLDLCGPEQGWEGAGLYLLPLMKGPGETYQLAAIPAGLGFAPRQLPERLRIYPATPAALAQLRQLGTGRE